MTKRFAGTGNMRSSAVAAPIATLLILLTAPVAPTAQADRFEGKLPFKVDQSQSVNATVGPVKVTTLKVTNLGRGYGRGGFGPKLGSASELSATIRMAFDVDNPRDEDWELTFTVELIDKAGKIVDRAAKKENFEGEAKVFNFDHPVLEYVLPLIADVRVTVQGRRD